MIAPPTADKQKQIHDQMVDMEKTMRLYPGRFPIVIFVVGVQEAGSFTVYGTSSAPLGSAEGLSGPGLSSAAALAGAPGSPLDAGDVISYARYCKQEVLEIGPDDPLPFKYINCSEDGVVKGDGANKVSVLIPTHFNGKPVNTEELSKEIESKGCDDRQWLQGVCEPFTLEHSIRDTAQAADHWKNADVYLTCRQYKDNGSPSHDHRWESLKEKYARVNASKDSKDFKDLFEFNDIAMIWRNRKNGKVCFFQALGSLYGGAFPMPDNPNPPKEEDLPNPRPGTINSGETISENFWKKDARTFWHSPAGTAGIRCIRCHDSSQFMHSPWIDQAKMVPTTTEFNDLPWVAVGRAFKDWGEPKYLTELNTAAAVYNPKSPGNRESNACTQCHKIASLNTCSSWIDLSTGKLDSADNRDWFNKMPQHYWMPYEHDFSTAAEWEDAKRPSVDAMKCCCGDHSALGCSEKQLGFYSNLDGTNVPAQLPGWVAGTGVKGNDYPETACITPQVARVTPDSGPVEGGTAVKIVGAWFTSNVKITFKRGTWSAECPQTSVNHEGTVIWC